MGILLVIQFLATMLFYPLRIGAYGHVSLAHDKLELNVTLLGISVARVRIRRDDGRFKLLVNGKPLKPSKKLSVRQVKNVVAQYRIEGIKLSGNLLALIGAQDAKTTAMLCAGIYGIAKPMMQNLNVYTSGDSDTFEIDGRLKIKINVLQIASLIFAGLRGNNG